VLIVTVHKRGKREFGLPFLAIVIMKRGSKFATRVYRKPTDTGRYLHLFNHPHHVERRVLHSLVRQTEVICPDVKDFSKEVKI
jgi:hypothetical protein